MIPTKRLRFVLIALLAVFGCDLGGNSGSETTNGLAGKANDGEGKPMIGARVRLIAPDYNPVEDRVTAEIITDGKGGFEFSNVTPGRYNLEMSEVGQGRMALIQDLVIPVSGTVLANGILNAPGKVMVPIADFITSDDSGYVYVPGTGAMVSIGAESKAQGKATVNRIPAGLMDSLVLVFPDEDRHFSVTIARAVVVVSGKETHLPPFASWSHSRSIALDTKAMGIVETLTDFPLLVRLTSEDSIFDQPIGSGNDLRFSRAGEHSLAYQVERWDSATRQAEIWVRVDTVFGNRVDQGIRMHWGNTKATLPTQSSPVFDSHSGFATVYHLSELPNSNTSGYKDASTQANHATSATLFSNSQVTGVIGFARNFAGTPTSADVALTASVPSGFGGNSSFTVSFWMRCRILPQRQGILDFGAFDLQKDMHFLLRPDTTIQMGAYDKNLTGADRAPWQSVLKVPSLPGRWAHLAAVYDSTRSTLEVYLDGSRVDSLQVPAMAIDAVGGLRIGRPIWTDVVGAEEFPFNGDLDEIRFESKASSTDRIRLDYLTQKP